MGEQMTTEVAVSPELFLAMVTRVWFDVGVRQLMCLEIGSLIEGSAALETLVRGVFHVQHFVDCKGSALAEALSAFCALERLFFRMYIPGN